MKNFLNAISNNLISKDDIWFSKEKSNISYPDEGHEICFQLEENSFWFKHRNNCIFETVKHFSYENQIIDIGGGNGYVSTFLQKNNYEVALIEPGVEGCLNAKKRGLKNVVCSTFQNIGITNNSISNIGIFDVLEHIENDLEFLKNLNSILKTEGKLFITVPAYKFLWSNEDILAGHFRRYTIKQITNVLKQAGFEVEFSSYIFSILVLPIFLFRTIPSLFKKPKKVDLQKNMNEHKQSKSSTLLQKIWNWEVKKISNKRKINFGTSCLIVAKKN